MRKPPRHSVRFTSMAPAPLSELRRRARRLRWSIASDPDIRRVVDRFSLGFMEEQAFHDASRWTEDPKFDAVVSENGLLGARFPGESFQRLLLYCPALELFHGTIVSARRIGVAFQFAGDTRGVVALTPLAAGSATDCFRYTIAFEQDLDGTPTVYHCAGGRG